MYHIATKPTRSPGTTMGRTVKPHFRFLLVLCLMVSIVCLCQGLYKVISGDMPATKNVHSSLRDLVADYHIKPVESQDHSTGAADRKMDIIHKKVTIKSEDEVLVTLSKAISGSTSDDKMEDKGTKKNGSETDPKKVASIGKNSSEIKTQEKDTLKRQKCPVLKANMLRIWDLEETYSFYDYCLTKHSAETRLPKNPSTDTIFSLTADLAHLKMVEMTHSKPLEQHRESCKQVEFSNQTLPLTGLVSIPGSGDTWARHLIELITGITCKA